MSANLLIADRWEYLAEGNAHVVFTLKNDVDCESSSSDCQNTSQSAIESSITIIQKNSSSSSTLNSSQPSVVMRICKTSSGDEHDLRKERDRSIFVERILKPCIGETYLNLPLDPSPLKVTKEFLSELNSRWRKSGKVPSSRLVQWNADSWSKSAILYRNIRTGHKYTIEIKPKCGFLPTTPLIHPNHRSKYTKHRFGLMQELMSNGHITKGWQTTSDRDNFRPSKYSPLDFFSGEPHRVRSSLEALVNNPQNNIRIWYDGSVILDNEKNCFTEFDRSRNTTGAIESDIVLESATEIFSNREHILSSLLYLQKADIIDVDGASLIYDRLVQICGSNYEAEATLTLASCNSTSFNFEDLIPLPKPKCSALNCLLKEFLSMASGWYQRSAEQVNETRDRCLNLISLLSKDACIWLLQGWLISLCSCDASIMLSMTFNDRIDDEEGQAHQSSSSNGIVHVRNKTVSYAIKLIDIDPKPASKLRGRKIKESILSMSHRGH